MVDNNVKQRAFHCYFVSLQCNKGSGGAVPGYAMAAFIFASISCTNRSVSDMTSDGVAGTTAAAGTAAGGATGVGGICVGRTTFVGGTGDTVPACPGKGIDGDNDCGAETGVIAVINCCGCC